MRNWAWLDIYAKAPAAKVEVDALAREVADQFGGTVQEAPIKSVGRALDKLVNDYDGDATRIIDLARNTVIVEPDQIEAAAELSPLIRIHLAAAG